MRKLFTFLCAALMSVGMYAQSSVQAIEFAVPYEWQDDVDAYYTAADLPGFTPTTLEQAQVLQSEISTTPGGILIYGFSGNQALYIEYNMFYSGASSGDAKKIRLAESVYDYGDVVYYTTGGSTPEPEPEPAEVTVVFAANSNTVERTVTLPHEFVCSYYNGNGELDAIIQELYGISDGHCSDYNYPVASGNEAVSAGSYGDDNYITISAAFEGTATVTGSYYDGSYADHNYTLTISIKGGSTPEPENTNVNITPTVDPQNTTYYYSTFFDSQVKYLLPEGVEAYVATISGDALTLTKIAVAGQTIPANNAVIFRATDENITLTPSTADAVTFSATNSLQGTDEAIATPDNCYVLSDEDGKIGFYHYEGNNLNPHKAYITYIGSGAPRRMRFIFAEEQNTTALDNAAADNMSVKVIENGQLIIIRDGVRYNAVGQIIRNEE